MPDQAGKQSGPGTRSPDQAYKDGRPEDVQEGSLGVDTGGPGVQESRLPESRDEAGSFQSGGFAGQQADDSPDAGTLAARAGEGDPSPHRQPESLKTEEAGGGLEVGAGASNPAPGTLGDDDPDEVGRRGAGQQPGSDAADPADRQQHPRSPSDMGSR